MDKDTVDYDPLVQSAVNVRDNAYARYSGFRVGAAVVASDGEVFTGCNVENASYGLTICAERIAVSSAISAGHRQFTAMVIASPGGVTPCGACRQFLAEFGNLGIVLVDVDNGNARRMCELDELLPDSFSL